MTTAPITVIILTFNEEANLEETLDSVIGWASEIFVVDSFSTDRTLEIALGKRGEGVQVVQHPFENYSTQWNWAIERLPISRPWILKLDADEQLTSAFREEVSRRLADAAIEEAAFILHRRLVFLGRSLRWGGTFPNGHLRLWRAGRGRFEDREVNEHVIVDGKIGEIQVPFEHHDKKSLVAWLDRHNRYSSMEARALICGNVVGEVEARPFGGPEERRMWLRKIYYRLPFRPFWYFLYRYLFRLGFLDGTAGFAYAFLHSSYRYWIDLKRREYERTGHLPPTTWPPRGESHPIVARSDLQKRVDAALPAAPRTDA